MSTATAPAPAPSLDVNDVAAQLGVNPRTVRRHVDAGRIGHLRVGHLLRFRQEDVDAFLADCTREAAPTRSTPEAYADHIARLVAAAPPLTDEQRTKIAALLKPVSGAV